MIIITTSCETNIPSTNSFNDSGTDTRLVQRVKANDDNNNDDDNNDDDKHTFTEVITADGYGILKGLDISKNRTPIVRIATALSLGAVCSVSAFLDQQGEIQAELNGSQSLSITELIERFPNHINPYRPIINYRYGTQWGAFEYGRLHNSIIIDYIESEYVPFSSSNSQDIIHDVVSITQDYINNNEILWGDIEFTLYTNIEDCTLDLPAELQNFLSKHDSILLSTNKHNYCMQIEQLAEEVSEFDISEEEKELIYAYLSTERSSNIMWQPVVPYREPISDFILINGGIVQVAPENYLDYINTLQEGYCKLYCIYGSNGVAALCFYEQDNTLFSNDAEYLTLPNLHTLIDNIDIIPSSGIYPIHHSTTRNHLSYIVLDEISPIEN